MGGAVEAQKWKADPGPTTGNDCRWRFRQSFLFFVGSFRLADRALCGPRVRTQSNPSLVNFVSCMSQPLEPRQVHHRQTPVDHDPERTPRHLSAAESLGSAPQGRRSNPTEPTTGRLLSLERSPESLYPPRDEALAAWNRLA
ncbi:hypothetical protein psal_cds_1169 [Pandoravirus salinus]|uniref:Uncharacterized protein n=1 Tax=Pandoravirus salinus TaxID=1349410 RepID=S4VXQ4_9VIRU|nr:hypothetical protein psal_cds_1169 [Pandoravirus salinus]AGO85444.1 hypothetical protein psal_cds_1169 [Pandoravirus salinus]